MLLTLQCNVSVSLPIFINGEQIQQTTTAKLLGVNIDDHLMFKAHVTTNNENTRAETRALLAVKCHGVNKTIPVKYYQSNIEETSYTLQELKLQGTKIHDGVVLS